MSEDDLTSESSDEVLERVGTVSASGAVTFAYCTYWYECGWPSLEIERSSRRQRDWGIIDASSDALHNVIFSQ